MTDSSPIIFVSSLLAHVAAHLAGHEALSAVKWRLSDRSLQNHDVLKCVRKSYLAALDLLEQRYRTSRPDKKPRREAQVVFSRLRLQAAMLFPSDSSLSA